MQPQAWDLRLAWAARHPNSTPATPLNLSRKGQATSGPQARGGGRRRTPESADVPMVEGGAWTLPLAEELKIWTELANVTCAENRPSWWKREWLTRGPMPHLPHGRCPGACAHSCRDKAWGFPATACCTAWTPRPGTQKGKAGPVGGTGSQCPLGVLAWVWHLGEKEWMREARSLLSIPLTRLSNQ